MTRRWEVIPQAGDVVNVIPETGSDQIQHQLDDDCICGPSIEPVQRDDGSIGWLFTHHSLDGREAGE